MGIDDLDIRVSIIYRGKEHCIGARYNGIEAENFRAPRVPKSPDPMKMFEYERQNKRHELFVEMISTQLAMKLAKALEQ